MRSNKLKSTKERAMRGRNRKRELQSFRLSFADVSCGQCVLLPVETRGSINGVLQPRKLTQAFVQLSSGLGHVDRADHPPDWSSSALPPGGPKRPPPAVCADRLSGTRASQVALTVENSPQCRRRKSCGFSPWVGKVLCRRKWQPAPVFLPGKSHGQRPLAGCSPWGHKECDMTDRLNNNNNNKRVAWPKNPR